MTLPEIDKHAIEAFRRFYKLLPRDTDQVLVVLKVHLLVEEQVRAFLEERVHNGNALAAAKLDCHAAICLAEALCSEDIHPKVWEAARKLNELRNKVAHNLEPTGIKERMDNICELIGLDLKALAKADKMLPPGPADDFVFAVAMLHGELSLVVKRKSIEVY